jgi:hypothetical protein
MTVLYGPCRKPSAIARLEAAMIDTSQNAHAQASPGVIVGPSAGFSVRYPQGWAVWGYAGKAFLAPSLDPRLTVHGYGLQAARGFSMQISDWSSYKYPEYLRLIALAVTEAKSEGASVVHSQVTIAGHLSERYHVIYPPGPAKLFSPGRDPRFLRACAACEAEYTLIRWPGSTWEVPLRVDVVAHPGTRLADYRAAVNATLGSLAPSSALSNGSHGYVSVGPHDGALETVMSFMEARIEGHRAESFLDASTQLRYRKSGDLYWFTHKDLAPSYQVSARVPIDKNTTRFEVLISESCRSRDICGIGRSHIEFLDVRIIDGRGTIVGAPGCRFSSAALRACLFSLF